MSEAGGRTSAAGNAPFLERPTLDMQILINTRVIERLKDRRGALGKGLVCSRTVILLSAVASLAGGTAISADWIFRLDGLFNQRLILALMALTVVAVLALLAGLREMLRLRADIASVDEAIWQNGLAIDLLRGAAGEAAEHG